MLSSSIKRLNRSTRLMTADDISDSAMANRPSAAFNQCWYYLQQSAYDRALDESTKIIRREPNNPEGYVLKSRSLFQLKRYEESEDVLLQVMRIAEQTQLTRTDMEAFIILKYELVLIRKQILKREGINGRWALNDLLKKFRDDFTEPVKLLLRGQSSTSLSSSAVAGSGVGGFQTSQSIAANTSDNDGDDDKSDTSTSVVTITPRRSDSPTDTYYSTTGDVDDHHHQNLIDFNYNTNTDNKSFDENKMITICAAEYYRLKETEDKALTLELKAKDLEDELSEVYVKLIQLTKSKNQMDQLTDRLKTELYFMAAQKQSSIKFRSSSSSSNNVGVGGGGSGGEGGGQGGSYYYHRKPIPTKSLTSYKQRLGLHLTASTAANKLFQRSPPKSSKQSPNTTGSTGTVTVRRQQQQQPNIRPIYHNKKSVPFVEY